MNGLDTKRMGNVMRNNALILAGEFVGSHNTIQLSIGPIDVVLKYC